MGTADGSVRGDVSPERIRVLHVDDDQDFADLVATFLEREDDRIEVSTATGAGDGLDRLADGGFDCVVSDYDMSGGNGIEFLESVREDRPGLPFILFTGKGSEEVASDAISAGVTDYLQKEGNTSQYTVLANRITNAVEQHRSRQAIEETERKLSQIAEESEDVLFMFDGDWSELLFINSAYEDVWGGSVAELEADPESFLEYVHPEDRDKAIRSMERLSDGTPTEVEYRVIRPGDGERRWVRGQSKPVFDDDGNVTRIVGSVRDITDRVERERELERYERLVEAMGDAVYVLDPDGYIVEVNERMEDLTGYDRGDLLGEHVSLLLDEDDVAKGKRTVEELLSNGDKRVGTYEETIHTADGGTVRCAVRQTLRPRDGEEFRGTIGTVRDITDREERERKLRESERALAALHGVANDLAASETPDEVCRRTVEAAEDLLEFDLSVVALEEDGVLRVRATTEDIPPDSYDSMSVDEGLAGKTYRTGNAFLVDDVENCGDAKPQGPFRSVLSLPIGDHGNFQAVADTPGAFDEDDLRLAELLTTHAGNTLDKLANERNLERERDRRSALFDNVPDPVVRVRFEDGSTVIEEINPAFEERFGYDPGTVVGTTPDSAFVPAGMETESAEIDRQVRNGAVVEREVRRDTAEGTREFLFRGIPIDKGERNDEAYGVYVDITEQRKRGQALETLHSVTRDLIEAETEQGIADRVVEAAENILGFPIAMVRLYDGDVDGLVPAASTDRIEDSIGDRPTFTREQESLNWEAFESGTRRVYDDVSRIDRAFDSDTGLRSLVIVPLADHGTLSAGATTPGAFDENDVSLAGILATTAATALARIEREGELIRQRNELERQNERLEEFTSIVSHDLRNPLNVATGRLELAREECDSDHLNAVARSHDRMEALIEDLLALAREGEVVAETEPVDLAELVAGCWRNVDTADATLVAGTDATVRADRGRVQQLLENLFRNAVEHGGPDVTVTVGDLDDGFYVEDDGPGIPEGERERVFESSYSTTEAGTGFGLAIVQEIAEAHGWAVGVADSEGGGARFEITGVEFAAG